MKKLLACCALAVMIGGALVSTACTGGYTCARHWCTYTSGRCSACGRKAPVGRPIDLASEKGAEEKNTQGKKQNWYARWIEGVLDMVASPALATHGGSGSNWGARNGSHQSGNGISSACGAKLHVCFNTGHNALPAGVSNQECKTTYCPDTTSPDPQNLACSLSDCQSRCDGWLGGTGSCS